MVDIGNIAGRAVELAAAIAQRITADQVQVKWHPSGSATATVNGVEYEVPANGDPTYTTEGARLQITSEGLRLTQAGDTEPETIAAPQQDTPSVEDGPYAPAAQDAENAQGSGTVTSIPPRAQGLNSGGGVVTSTPPGTEQQ